jgi:YVTN family beta-propeller protein
MSFSSLAIAVEKDFHVQQHFDLGAPGKWDYTDIDPVRHRLFLSRGDRVQVLELPSGKPVGEIKNTAGVHGIAFAQDLKLGFTSNGASNSVTVFDLESLVTIAEIKIEGVNPDAILYEPQSHKLYTFNGKSNDVTVIDAKKQRVIATIKVNGKPEFAVSDGIGKIYVNIEDHPGVDVIDVASNTKSGGWTLAACEEPTGIALDITNARLFSSCRNKVLAVSDTKTGKRIADVIIGAGPDAVIFDADKKMIYTSNGGGAGSISVIQQVDADHYQLKQTVATSKGTRTMAMDLQSKTIYLPALVEKAFHVIVVGQE